MASLNQLEQILPTLSNPLLREYANAVNRELFRRMESYAPTVYENQSDSRSLHDSYVSESDSDDDESPVTDAPLPEPKVLTTLPWTTTWGLPPWRDALERLENYQPVTTTKDQVVNQVKMFLELVERSSGAVNKAKFSRYLFQLLSVNIWFMEEHERFRVTVKNKILEFEADNEQAQAIAKEFAWLKEYPYPDLGECAYCGIVGRWPIVDSDDTDTHFCCEEHLITFVNNGDCAHDPTLTKEQLDQELDEYMSRHPDRIDVRVASNNLPPGLPPLVAEEPASYWSEQGKYQAEYDQLHRELVPDVGPAETDDGNLLAAASKAYYRQFNDGDDMSTFKREYLLHNIWPLTDSDHAFLCGFNPKTEAEWDRMIDQVIERIQARRD